VFDFEEHYRTIERQESERFHFQDFDLKERLGIARNEQSLFGTTNSSTPAKINDFQTYCPSSADLLFDQDLFWTPPMVNLDTRGLE
jgi:hypothetical protein